MPDTFTYVTYVRTMPEKLWDALTKPEFTRAYWCECWHDTTWQPGSSWKLMIPDGRVGDAGEVIECDKPKRLVLKWRNEFLPGMREEGYSLCTFELAPIQGSVRLAITHTAEKSPSQFIAAVSEGWPMILSSLKSLIETGQSLDHTRKWPENL